MKKERFTFICSESEEGRDAFVTHPSSKEEGQVLNCTQDHIVVKTNDGKNRCWDYKECEELSRSKEEFPWR